MDDQRGVLSPCHLLIDGSEIVAVGGPSEIPQIEVDHVIDFSDKLVMPGLVNAHAHTPMSLFRGLAEGISLFTMDGFINCLRRLEAAADSSMVPAAVEVSCAEMIRTGTTCFADQYFYMREIYPVVDRSGLRAALAYGIVELGDEESRQREIKSVTAFLESFTDHPRIKGWVGPHAFFVDNSEEIIALELELARRFDTGLHIHFATSSEEEDYCQAKFGISAVERMKQLGILEYPILAAHAITVPASDYDDLAKSPFTAVICASSSMRSGFSAAPGVIPAKDILEMATLGGAKALGWEDRIGSLEAGKLADLIALDLNDIGWGPRGAQDLYTAIVYAISGMHVTDVMVDGQWLLQDKQWTTMDYTGAAQQMDADYLRLKQNLEKH